MKRSSAGQHLYQRFRLPSGKLVEVRKVADGNRPEVIVREVNGDNELSAHEFYLRLDFLLQRATPVRNL